MRKIGIYKIKNNKNDKVYIGSSNNMERRFKDHARLLENNKHYNKYLQNAWNKYDFFFEIIEIVESEDILNEREQSWMDFYNSYDREYGYNIAPKADRTVIAEETKKRMSESRKGKKRPEASGWHHSEEAKDKIGKAQSSIRKGIKLSDKTKQKIGDRCRNKTYEEMYGIDKANEMKENIRKCHTGKSYCLGKKATKETRKKMSISHIGFRHTEEMKKQLSKSKLKSNNPQYKNIPSNTIELIIELYGKLSIRKISKKVRQSEHIVKRVLLEQGVINEKVT